MSVGWQIVFWIFLVHSFFIGVYGITCWGIHVSEKTKNKEYTSKLARLLKKPLDTNATISPFLWMTIMIAVATLLIHIPFCYGDDLITRPLGFLRPLFVAVLNTIQTFLADGVFEGIAASVWPAHDVLHIAYLFWSAVLYTLAPLLTFGNLLSLFKQIKDEARYHLKRQNVYVMSELNERSMALGESIYNSTKEKVTIVFTDVFEQNEETQYELILRAKKINALCLKRDASTLPLSNKQDIKIFLIGENESENLEQAVKLTAIIKGMIAAGQTSHLPSVYVYASSPGSELIINSLSKGDLILDASFENQVREIIRNPDLNNEERLTQINLLTSGSTDVKMSDGFILRRIDSIEEMVLSELTSEKLLTPLLEQIERDRRISLLIVGMGPSGRQFLKTALWLFQHIDYRLEITVIDKSKADPLTGKSEIELQFEQDCPEIMSMNPCTIEGENNYDIRFETGIDCFSSRFDRLFEEGASSERLKRTQLAIVTLGDDDKNIEASIMLRKIFDRVKEVSKKQALNAPENEIPMISAIVYDSKKSANLNASGEASLRNFAG
ncbi:MAG: hypothetical protein J6B77_02405, partial [Clostridia bacterium]|nr:hypothetical protein [Clostridia bacterium]